jgi:hypothetical protein
VVAVTADLRNIVQQARTRAHEAQAPSHARPGTAGDSTEFQPPSAGTSF